MESPKEAQLVKVGNKGGLFGGPSSQGVSSCFLGFGSDSAAAKQRRGEEQPIVCGKASANNPELWRTAPPERRSAGRCA